MSIEKFIADRETPYSRIKDIRIKGDVVFYTEEYDLNHPLCPITRIEDKKLEYKPLTANAYVMKDYFEKLYGRLNEEEKR